MTLHTRALRAGRTHVAPSPGQPPGIFIRQSVSNDALVMDDDRHLRLRLAAQWHGNALGRATVVHGRATSRHPYMGPVAPVHRKRVPHLLRRQLCGDA